MKKTNTISLFKPRLILLANGIAASSALLLSRVAHASSCDTTETILIQCSNDVNGIWALMLMLLNILTAGVGIVAVGGIVYGAILYTSAGDQEDQVNRARGIITNVIIGVVTFAFMFSGLQYLIPGGVFNQTYGVASMTTKDAIAKKAAAAKAAAAVKASKSSAQTATGSITSVQNIRDASSLTGVLAPNTLFRSARLGSISASDTKTLAAKLGNGATIIDLRAADKRAAVPDKQIPGATNISVPIEGISDTSPMVTDPVRRAQVGKALKIAANASGNVLIHCTAGKDRTGWLIAMIMYANGASDAQVMQEYLKSLDAYPGGVERAYLSHGVQTARNKYGSINGYLRATGLSSGDIEKLKSKFGA